MDQVTGLEYGLNVGQWIMDHPDYVLQGGFEGVGFTARRRSDRGRTAGRPIVALTLDELAALVTAHRG